MKGYKKITAGLMAGFCVVSSQTVLSSLGTFGASGTLGG